MLFFLPALNAYSLSSSVLPAPAVASPRTMTAAMMKRRMRISTNTKMRRDKVSTTTEPLTVIYSCKGWHFECWPAYIFS